MAEVDPDDDGIKRFVAQHFRYDPARRQRRNVILAAFEDEAEFESFVSARSAALRAKQTSGEADQREHILGEVREPGHRARARNQRLLSNAFEHGVWPAGWDPDDPPEGIHIVTARVRQEGGQEPEE